VPRARDAQLHLASGPCARAWPPAPALARLKLDLKRKVAGLGAERLAHFKQAYAVSPCVKRVKGLRVRVRPGSGCAAAGCCCCTAAAAGGPLCHSNLRKAVVGGHAGMVRM
jgi:hypothetical protein